MRIRPAWFALVVALLSTARPAPAADEPQVERYLLEGKLAQGEKALQAALAEDPKDAQARYGLGVIQFLRGVEGMIQSFHRHGLTPAGGAIPFLRLPVPENPDPEPIGYDDLRGIFRQFIEDTARAEATLAQVDDPAVRLPIHFGRIRLDFDGDGKAGEEETLWKIYARFNRGVDAPGPRPGEEAPDAKAARELAIGFDRGDVAWMRGYCHLLMAMAEVFLAHDGEDLFNHSAHLVFARPRTPFPFLKPPRKSDAGGPEFDTITDVIATIHMIRLPVAEARRMAAALGHLEAMVQLSRESWRFYLAETDDDHEWIPNPKQSTVMPGGTVTDEMVKGWMEFLDEAQAIYAGKVLIPFWRDPGGSRGINLRRAFTEPHGLDLVLWVQGTAAAPYLEEGSITKPEFWGRMQRIFRGEFIGFVIWFN
jgi:hypothetical protein